MTTVRNFHLPLPEPLYERLREAAERAHQPATALARYAIDQWLRQHRRTLVQEAIAAYAAEVAGTKDDLDEALEAASLEHLAAEEQHTTRRKSRPVSTQRHPKTAKTKAAKKR